MADTVDPHQLREGQERDPRPTVALPRQGLPGAVIAGIGALLALALFLVLDSQRRRAKFIPAQQAAEGAAFVPPPALTVPPESAPAAAPATTTIVTSPLPRELPPRGPAPTAPNFVPPVTIPSQPIELSAPGEPPASHQNSPALVFDVGAEGTGSTSTETAASGAGNGATGANPAASANVSNDAPVRATVIRNRTTIMPVGTLIPAVLETPIDTSRPGLVRAVVSRDARGFDGSRVLVPRGSRLIGEYQSDVRPGQNRVLVTWVRLIRPDGVAIQLGSPTADRLGGAGVPGRVNSFFFQRFAAAVLQSALTIGVNVASRPGNGSVIVGLPASQVGNSIGQGLIPGNDLQPKITVKQGAALNVFVAHDLDFSGTGGRTQ